MSRSSVVPWWGRLFWGVRSDRTPGVSRSVDKQARKDAEESARAQMYYGKGAGTRRKRINKTVEDRAKRNPDYDKAFKNHQGRQDIGKHAEKAMKERNKTDRKDRNSQRRGAVARRVTGSQGTQAAYVALGAAGLAYLNSPQGRRTATRLMNEVNSGAAGQTIRRGIRQVGRNLSGV